MLSRRRLRGVSLVELLVGLALGLFVAAGASLMAVTQLTEHRRLLLDAQVRQELRRSADLVQRELRRAGYWRQAQDGVWSATRAGVPHPLPDLSLLDSQVGLHYQRRPDLDGPFGFKLQDGALKVRMAGAGWQDLTDVHRLHLTAFSVEEPEPPPPATPCPAACAEAGAGEGPPDDSGCVAPLRTRHLRVHLEGHAAHDPSRPQQLGFELRVRNDRLADTAPAGPEAAC